jgi:hypothetical protein
MKKFVACIAAVLLGSSAVIAAELKSGLEIGDGVQPFYVQDVTGPSAGKDPLCYRCQYGSRPVVAIFTRKVDDKVAALVKEVDAKVAKSSEKKMAAFVVVLSDDPASNEAKLKELAKKEGIKIPLTTFEKAAGPEEYKISKEAEVTVMEWVGGKVKATRAFAPGKLNEEGIKGVISDTAKILE